MLKAPRFRRFSSRLLLFMVGLVALVQIGTYVLVDRANKQSARDRILEELERGAGLFQRDIDGRLDDVGTRASLLEGDFALRQLFLQEQLDRPTLASALETYRSRIRVSTLVLIAPDGALLGAAGRRLPAAGLEAFRSLVRQAAASEAGEPRARAFAWIREDRSLYAFLVVPLYAPPPEVLAWTGLSLAIDRTFADALKRDTRLDITFLAGPSGDLRPVDTTLPRGQAETVARAANAMKAGLPGSEQDLAEGGSAYVSLVQTLPLATPGAAAIALQRSLEDELAPARRLERFLQWQTAGSLVVAIALALVAARGISEPVRVLARHTGVIAGGDYHTRLALDRSDELGDLSAALNQMSEGLAERDKVRDLLDRNVSPEVATQLMRDGGAALGGEEREVTVLFADLRGFTKLAEPLAPRDLLALLNRYFDRVSAVIEAEHGVVDKYMGDEVMAVFGAPVPVEDSADRGIAAAAAILGAVAGLNDELRAEGHPTLSVGVGLNTARVVAGNIGSSRRLNYSVLGDGVNVAARLQDLTRRPEYGTSVILSASTLERARVRPDVRSLGSTVVRGREQPVGIYALVTAAQPS